MSKQQECQHTWWKDGPEAHCAECGVKFGEQPPRTREVWCPCGCGEHYTVTK